MNRQDYDAILITGPTASGKSALAVDLARACDGVVVNADSMQVYDTLRVLTARPSDEDMGGVEHRLYGHVPASSSYSTGGWLRDIGAVLADLRQVGKTPVIVGGTGLYFKALTGGLSEMPAIPEAVRSHWRRRLEEEGAAALHAELAAIDPETAARLKEADGQRIVRALEVFAATGKTLSHFQSVTGPALIDPGRARKIIVLPDRAALAERINRRFGLMLEMGALDEAKALLAMRLDPALPVMKAIGVPEIGGHLAGELSRAEVIERGSAATRQYAKRQMTWFRNQMDESWERISP